MEKKKESEKKCEECIFFINKTICDEEIRKAKELQQEYLEKIGKVNGTLAKYTKKMDELDGQTKKG